MAQKRKPPVNPKANAAEQSARRLRALGYDPVKDLYREHAKDLAASKDPGDQAAYFIDRLAYEIFGIDLIGSLAFALDPYARFRMTDNLVVKVNRKKWIPGVPPSPRSYIYKTPNSTVAYQTVHGTSSPDFNVHDDTPKGGAFLTAQQPLDGFLYDTTFKSRGKDKSIQGEFELYVPKIKTTPWYYTWRERDNVSINDAPPITTYHARSIKDHFTQVTGPSMRIAKADHDLWLTNYKLYALSSLAQQAPGLISKCLPESRQFNLSYNIAELRELPALLRDLVLKHRHLLELLKSLKDPKAIANLYLEYKFGWESTMKAIRSMLSLPESIAKKVNYLVSRNGKFTTLRTKKLYSEPMSSSPTFNFEIYPYDVVLDSYSISGKHDVEVRCAINSLIQFPPVDVPKIREDLILKLWGADPQPADVYNLIPWTWLIDWFSGLGEYVNCISALANDKHLINWGLVTFASKGQITTNLKLKGDGSQVTAITGQPTVTVPLKYRPNRDASLLFKYQVRRSVTSLDGVKIMSSMSGLSTYQTSILAALMAKYGPGAKKAGK